ncbi:MAG: hypothetical protein EVA65_10095 [Oceanococcus sp.]|nr:MAG: hypothetical protein EVA65_10095 [Oceanococcus sp.]
MVEVEVLGEESMQKPLSRYFLAAAMLAGGVSLGASADTTGSYSKDFNLDDLARQLSNDFEEVGLDGDITALDTDRQPSQPSDASAKNASGAKSSHIPPDAIWLAAAGGKDSYRLVSNFSRVSNREYYPFEVLSIYFLQKGKKGHWYFVNHSPETIECLQVGGRQYVYGTYSHVSQGSETCITNIPPGEFHEVSELYFPYDWPTDKPIDVVRLFSLKFKYQGKENPGGSRFGLLSEMAGGTGVNLSRRKRELNM